MEDSITKARTIFDTSPTQAEDTHGTINMNTFNLNSPTCESFLCNTFQISKKKSKSYFNDNQFNKNVFTNGNSEKKFEMKKFNYFDYENYDRENKACKTNFLKATIDGKNGVENEKEKNDVFRQNEYEKIQNFSCEFNKKQTKNPEKNETNEHLKFSSIENSNNKLQNSGETKAQNNEKISQESNCRGPKDRRASSSSRMTRSSTSSSRAPLDPDNLFPAYVPVTFKFFNQSSKPRYWCLKLITWSYPLFLPSFINRYCKYLVVFLVVLS